MKNKIGLITILIVLIILFSFFAFDKVRANKDRLPIFAVYTTVYDDGGSKKYTGLFYNVYSLHYYNPAMTSEWVNEDGTIKEEYKDKLYVEDIRIVPWFYSIERTKDRK